MGIVKGQIMLMIKWVWWKFFRHAFSKIEPPLLGHQRSNQRSMYFQIRCPDVRGRENILLQILVLLRPTHLSDVYNHQLRCSQSNAKNAKTFIMQ